MSDDTDSPEYDKWKERYTTHVFDDQALSDNKSVEDFRIHYKEWSARNGIEYDQRGRQFLAIDAERLRSVVQTPKKPDDGSWVEHGNTYTKFAETDFDPRTCVVSKNNRQTDFPRVDTGVIRVTIWSLFRLWGSLESGNFKGCVFLWLSDNSTKCLQPAPEHAGRLSCSMPPMSPRVIEMRRTLFWKDCILRQAL